MFRPEEMCELSLLVLSRDIEDVTEVIARQGVLHQVDTSYLSREEEWDAKHWEDQIHEYQGIEQRILLIMGALDVPEVMTAPEQELNLSGDLAELQHHLLQIEQDVMPLVNKLKENQQRLMELEALTRRLEPLSGLDLDLRSLRSLTFLHVQIGIIPTANLDRLNVSLLHVPHIILPLGVEGAGTLVAIFGAAKDAEVLERAAHSAYLSPISIPEEYRGTPQVVLNNIRNEISALREERSALDQHIVDARAKWGAMLRAALWRVRAALVMLRAIDHFGQVRDVYLVAGWIPSRQVSTLVSEVKRVTEGRVAVDVTPAEQSSDLDSIPVTLNNRGILRAFQGLVTNYAWPSYDEIDPTPFVAVTFSLMFGLMFGDVGHGLVLALAGALIWSRRVEKLKQYASFAPVLFLSGLSATVFGFLYGSFFGTESLPALWLRPLDSILSILVTTIAFGVVISIIGFVLSIIDGWLRRDWRRALFDRYGLAGMWFYLAIIGIVLGIMRGISLTTFLMAALTIPPLLLIVLGEPLINLLRRRRPLIYDSIPLFAVQSGFELFEALIGYLSSTLSYVRLGAFAVAHGGLSAVIFILADMAGGSSPLLYWLVVALGNLFIIGFEGLIVGIQTLRLEYYEFFSKFFRGGGVPYRPLRASDKKA